MSYYDRIYPPALLLLLLTFLLGGPSVLTNADADVTSGATGGMVQGGWDVWSVYLRDGSSQSAAPVWALDKNALRRGFSAGGGEGTPVERARISHMSNSLRNSEYARKKSPDFVAPPLPEGVFRQDLVVFDDGKRVMGSVMIRAGKLSQGKRTGIIPC